MENKPRIFNSEITIDDNNRWFFRGQEIVHSYVLDFFRENLFEDEKGIYILNTYGKFSEKGYLTCNGFPLFLIFVEETEDSLVFHSNNSKTYTLEELNFYFDDKQRLFCIHKNQRLLKFGLSKSVLNFLSEFLTEEEDKYFLTFNQIKKEINQFQDQFEVMVPVIL
jgi:hypothetical protein